MPLLTVNNLLTSPLVVQDPSGLGDGLGSLSLNVPASGSVTASVTLVGLTALEPLLVAEATAGNLTWSVADDPSTAPLDKLPDTLKTVLVTPYNAVAGDEVILTNLTLAGAVSVVLSASAQIGHEVQVADLKGDAGANNVTITVAGGGTINGGANLLLSTNKQKAWLVKVSATNWIGHRSLV